MIPPAFYRPNPFSATPMPPPRTFRIDGPEAQVLQHAIAPVTIHPQGTKPLVIDGLLLENGDITADSLFGPQKQGHLNPDGNYQLINGRRGNIFKDQWLQVSMGELTHPFINTLKSEARQRAVRGSEIPLIRQQLTNRGLDGRGIKIGILDKLDKDKKTGQGKQSPHTRTVMGTINDPLWGVAPGAQVEDLGLPFESGPEDLATDSYQAFANDMAQTYQKLMQQRSQLLNNLVAKRDPSLRVLNMTWGGSRALYYRKALGDVNKKDENGYYQYPLLRQTILGASVNGPRAQQMQAVVSAVDQIMDQNPLIQASHAQYVEATRQAANAGMILVGSAGNEEDGQIEGLTYRSGSQIDYFSDSPYVITVAAANSNQQPGNRAGYSVAPFSSRGDGVRLNPTIAAPGQEMGVSMPQGEFGHNLTVNGTSYATPFTCGVIALMLQRNPYLTFDQVKAKLQATAVKSPYYGVADYGAGFLNAEAAVLS